MTYKHRSQNFQTITLSLFLLITYLSDYSIGNTIAGNVERPSVIVALPKNVPCLEKAMNFLLEFAKIVGLTLQKRRKNPLPDFTTWNTVYDTWVLTKEEKWCSLLVLIISLKFGVLKELFRVVSKKNTTESAAKWKVWNSLCQREKFSQKEKSRGNCPKDLVWKPSILHSKFKRSSFQWLKPPFLWF